jgi:hypothetical protein
MKSCGRESWLCDAVHANCILTVLSLPKNGYGHKVTKNSINDPITNVRRQGIPHSFVDPEHRADVTNVTGDRASYWGTVLLGRGCV